METFKQRKVKDAKVLKNVTKIKSETNNSCTVDDFIFACSFIYLFFITFFILFFFYFYFIYLLFFFCQRSSVRDFDVLFFVQDTQYLQIFLIFECLCLC